MPWFLAFDAVVVLVVLAIVAVQGNWFGGGSASASSGRDGNLVPSNSRALSAAVIAHLPAGTKVIWASGEDDLGQLLPKPAGMAGAISASVLVEVAGHQYWFNAVSSPGSPSSQGQRIPATVIPSRDKQGRLTSELAMVGSSQMTVVIMEMAGPGGAGRLPLDDAGIRELIADPLVGPQTSPQMIERGKNLASFTDHPPAVKWPHSPI
jgi:hypothetical protein